uniref:Uncharacterized protein n=1 Tax=Ditylenchus dipsaci TaxID=166011 RepID=A0A915DWX8_9BILA
MVLNGFLLLRTPTCPPGAEAITAYNHNYYSNCLRASSLDCGLLYFLGTISCQSGADIFPVSCYLNVMIFDRSDSELNISPKAHSASMIVYSGNSYKREIYK